MADILNCSIKEMAGIRFDCNCGRHHSLPINHIAVGSGILPEILPMAEPFLGKPVLMVSDNNTFAAAGEQTLSLLRGQGQNVKSFVFETGGDILIPDERALGRLFMELECDTALIVAVGSGTINDMCKYMSARTGIPYIVVCTAPSMDGYAADGAPMICDGFKISFVATLPIGIVGDTDIMKDAPDKLIWAGYGDAIGKLTALADWKLAVAMQGEYHCATCAKLVEKALQKVIDNTEGIANRQPQAIGYLAEALILTGVAMGLIGVSRPASGAEHMLSHHWEMHFIAAGKYPELHGIKVGVATPIIARVFELLGEELPGEAMEICPKPEYVKGLLSDVGAPVLPSAVGVDRELFARSMMEAFEVRKRYSVLQYAVEAGKMQTITDIITKEIYG